MTTTKQTLDVHTVLNALERWIKQRPGLDWRDYGTDANGRRAYAQELRAIAKDRHRALAALAEARAAEPQPALLADAFRAFSGRLQWIPEPTNSIGVATGLAPAHLQYCTGQYWPTEYRKAAASVLETYVAACKQAPAREHPQTFTYRTMDDVRAANAAVGGHWFEPGFFKTRIESRLIVCGDLVDGQYREGTRGRFITSECGPDERRAYTVREARPDGSIDTVGEFQQFATLAAARAHVLMDKG